MGVNLVAVSLFGEFEFWFAIIKVLTVLGMILIGLTIILFGVSALGDTAVSSTPKNANITACSASNGPSKPLGKNPPSDQRFEKLSPTGSSSRGSGPLPPSHR
jgi:hypothetical protein